MTTRTRNDLADRVMQKLCLLDAHEETAAEDRSHIGRVYDNVLEEMRNELLVTWDADEIPYDTFEAVAELMKIVVGPDYGVPGPVGEDLNQLMEGAKRRIRKLSMKRSSGQPAQTEYF